MRRRIVAGIGLSAFAFIAITERAPAAEALGPAIVAWVRSIDASPLWNARIDGLAVDEAGRAATVESLLVSAEGARVAVAIEGLALDGYAAAPEGGFTARALTVAKATISVHGTDIVLSDVALDALGVPRLAGVAYQGWKPFTSLIAAYSAIAKSRTAGGRIAEVALIERFGGLDSRISYRDVSIGRLADGKLDAIRAGPLKVESPSPNPLVELTVERLDATAIDLDAFLRVYDPLRYIAGIGDGSWRPAVGRAAYTDITMRLPGIRLDLGAATTEDFRVRQPPESFAPLIDAMTRDRDVSAAVLDALGTRHMAGLISAFGVGRFTIERAALAAAGIDQLSFDRFEMSESSSDGFGAVLIEGLVGAVHGQGAVSVGHLALGDVVPPPAEAIAHALDGIERGADIDLSALAPRLGWLEAAAIDIRAIDFPGAALGRLRADFANHVGTVPTEVAVSIDDLDIATSSLQPARARRLIESLGYDRVRADAGFSLKWREADGTVRLDDFRLDIEDFGKTTASVVLAGLTRAAIERSAGARDMLADLLFERASLTFEDKSVVERSLSMRADLLNIPLDRLKQQLAGALPLMLAFVGNPEKVKEIVPVLQSFIRTPGTLAIEASPEPPVPVASIEEAARTRPQSLPGMLAISVRGTPGPGGEATPDTPPAIRRTIEPANRPDTTGQAAPIPAEPP